jgi:hypothetical protein
MWSTLFAFTFLFAVALSFIAIRLSLQNKIAAIGHRQSYFAGKLEPAQAMVIQLAD